MKRTFLAVAAVTLFITIILFYSNAHAQSMSYSTFTVRQYSGGKQVWEWQSFRVLETNEHSCSFYVGTSTTYRKVVVSGTYSVEQSQ